MLWLFMEYGEDTKSRLQETSIQEGTILAMNDKIFGQGINDIPGFEHHPLYRVWESMLEACYNDPKSVQGFGKLIWSWSVASNFLKWAETKWRPGLVLNLNLIDPLSRVYCSAKCCFVTQEVQEALQEAIHNDISGVSWCGATKKFVVIIKEYNHIDNVGSFDSFKSAKTAYLDARIAYLRRLAGKQPNHIKQGLRRFAKALEDSR